MHRANDGTPRTTGPVRRIVHDPALLALTSSVVVAVVFLVLWPHSGTDLAAQVARADASKRTGGSTWWGGWYGGISTPTYSILSAQVMSLLGAPITGALAFIVDCWLAGGLLRHTHRPRTAAVFAVVGLTGNLAVGRVTFGLGMVFALVALRLVQDHRPALPAALSAAGAALLSPLAAMFLGIICGAMIVVDPTRRSRGAWVCAAAALPVIVTTVLFPSPGIQPINPNGTTMPLVVLAILMLWPVPGVVRLSSFIIAACIVASLYVQSPVGSNSQRLVVIAAAPVIVALVRAPTVAIGLGVIAMLTWPMADVRQSVALANDASSHESYFQPVLDMLPATAQSGRLEVIETQGHWSSTYLATHVSLARGWERQVDRAINPIFYTHTLDAETYHQWLLENAVQWIAFPDTTPDWGSTNEAKLIDAGLPYLQEVWDTNHWRFYRVIDAAPVAPAPAVASKLEPSKVTVTVAAPGSMRLRVRWSPQLALDGPAGCLSDDAGWINLNVSLPGTYTLRGGFSPLKGISGKDAPVCTHGYVH